MGSNISGLDKGSEIIPKNSVTHSKRTLEKRGETSKKIGLEDCGGIFFAKYAAIYKKSHVSAGGQQERPNVFCVFRDIKNEKHGGKSGLLVV